MTTLFVCDQCGKDAPPESRVHITLSISAWVPPSKVDKVTSEVRGDGWDFCSSECARLSILHLTAWIQGCLRDIP